MIMLLDSSAVFLDGNSATFVATVMTWSILCFFSTKTTGGTIQTQSESSNFMQVLLHMICNRALVFLNKVQGERIHKHETENLKLLSKFIAESSEEKNPYKLRMLELVNVLQFQTVTFYNTYLEQKKTVESLHRKIETDSLEFFSSFLYAFLFGIFILSADCLGQSNDQLIINVITLTAIVSYTYWGLIWGHYFISIDKRTEETSIIRYEFKPKTCIIIFTCMLATIGIVNYFDVSTPIMNLIYIIGIILVGIVAMIKYSKRGNCIFTHYFNFIHFILVVIFLFVICWIQNDLLKNDILFSVEWAKFLSLTFVIASGLILPLCIPILKLNYEITRTNRKLLKAAKSYIKESQKLHEELNERFENLCKLKALIS